MKRGLLFYALSVLLLLSCTNELLQHEVCSTAKQSSTKAQSKESYLLTQADIDSYIHYLSIQEKFKDNKVFDISPVSYDGTVTHYIVNMDNGWRLISADKRGPIVLAESDTGRYNSEAINEEEQFWLDRLSEQILYRIYEPDKYYGKLDDTALLNERQSLDFWRAITVDESLFSKAAEKGTNRYPMILDSVRVFTVEYDSVDHLIPLMWHQGAPFNAYCPLTSEFSSTRCPAGCSAIATAQTMYYLHYKIGRPYSSPSTGICTGWVGNYAQSFSNYSSTNWDNMENSTDSNGVASLLIGLVGQILNMDYAPTGSGAFPSESSFAQFGINCSFEFYNEDTVLASLISEIPVICCGWQELTSNNELIRGHTFIIDGYKRSKTETHYFYSDILGNTAEEIVSSDPYLTGFRINWGWGIAGRSAFYSPSGTWLGYDLNKLILHGFMTENK